jgi:hypothetical protein
MRKKRKSVDRQDRGGATTGKAQWRRVLGFVAVLGAASGSLLVSGAPASAMTGIHLATGRNGALVATANIVPANSFVEIDEYDDGVYYRVVKTCSMATTCSAPFSYGPGSQIAFAATIVTRTGVFATSNVLSYAVDP